MLIMNKSIIIIFSSSSSSKVVPVYATKAYKRSQGIAPLLLNPGTKWRLVVNAMVCNHFNPGESTLVSTE
jgi:Na+/H+-dicarboxylate symporter